MSNRIQQVAQLGQAIWLDFISRDLLESGELRRHVNEGLTGVTSNPTIFQKAVAGSDVYDDQIRELAGAGADANAIYEALAMRDIAEAADQLRSVYDETSARDGFVSIEVNPHLAHDTAGAIEQGRRLFRTIDRPNVMIKVPATEAGIPAIRALIGDGINVNVTLIFSVDLYDKVMQAYIDGLRDRYAAGKPIGIVGSVASFFISRVDTMIDKVLQNRIGAGETGLGSLLGQAAIANARIAYDAFTRVFGAERFAALRAAGARVQRPLWASTGTKNPAYRATKYVDTLIGPDTVNTVPPNTLDAIRTQCTPARTIDLDTPHAYATIERLATAGISMAQVTSELLDAGIRSFAASFDELLVDVEVKRAKFAGA
jgi:transaldolase